MEIYWLGQSCFKIKSKEITLITDPYSPEIGLKMPKLEADIVTISHNHFDHNYLKGVSGEPFVVDGPGEYEFKGVNINGILSYHDEKKGEERGYNTIYLIEMEGLRICHLGDLGHILSDKIIDQLDGVDILMIPVGGFYTINAQKASAVINQINPKIIIPMHYKIDGLSFELDSVDKFCKEIGVCHKPQEKLSIKKNNLTEEQEEEVIILQKK